MQCSGGPYGPPLNQRRERHVGGSIEAALQICCKMDGLLVAQAVSFQRENPKQATDPCSVNIGNAAVRRGPADH